MHVYHGTWSQFEFTEITQHDGILVANAHHGATGAHGKIGERAVSSLVHHTVTRGNRRAMRIEKWIAECASHAIDERVGGCMFQLLGLGMHVVPGHTEHRGEVALEHAMPTQCAERGDTAVRRETCAAVRLMLEQPL